MRNALLFIVTLFGATLCFGAEVYPNKPVRVVVGFSPGGFADLVARLISPQLGEQLGEPFVVDNRTGAAGTIATAIVAKSAPDGYTLLLAEPGLTINAALHKSLSYDVAKDFTRIVQIARVTDVLVVPPSLKVNTIKEFIALAQANPGKLNYGSGGTGSTLHLYAELFNRAAKVNTTHVPYKGAAGTVTALLGGQIQMSFAAIPSVLQHVNSGRLRALAVTTDGTRSPLMPDVPSMSEAGIAGMTIYGWEGFIGPAGLPKGVVNKLHSEVLKAMAVPSVKERLSQLAPNWWAAARKNFQPTYAANFSAGPRSSRRRVLRSNKHFVASHQEAKNRASCFDFCTPD